MSIGVTSSLKSVASGCLVVMATAVDAAGAQQPEKPAAISKDTTIGVVETVTNSIGLKLVLIPPGEFLMGSSGSDEDAPEDEQPQHRVRITRPFYMGVYELTQEEYERVMGVNPSFFSGTGPGREKLAGQSTARFPVEQVSWPDAVEFCRRLSELPAEKQTRRTYRLPTEAEWEYACRGGTGTTFHFGASLSSRQANFNGEYPYGGGHEGPFLLRTAPVGSYPPNAFGLYDMHGNVWEWCTDRYGANYYQEAPREDPRGPPSGSNRVIRGGGWRSDGRDCRSSFRYADVPRGRYYVTGFRVIMTPAGSGSQSLATETPKGSAPGPVRLPRSPVRPERRALAQGEDWPQWRGPRGDGTWFGPELPEKWPPAGLQRLWQHTIGGGHAGVVVASGRVYAMDYQRDPEEVERVLCFDAASGNRLWSSAHPVKYGNLEYGNGPRATPTLSGGHLYALGALGHLHCLDVVSGKALWSAELLRDYHARLPVWGFAASPVVFEHLLIVHAGAEPNGCLLALDRATGKEVWRSLADPAGYATPILIECQGGPQLVCWSPSGVHGVEPRSGRRLWSVPFEVAYGTSIATPIFQENIVLVSGYWEGSRAIRVQATGATTLWADRQKLRGLMSQPLYRAGYGYLLDKRHGLTCFELKTGKKLWDDGNRMTPKGRNPQATLVWLGRSDRAIILNSDGDLVLARLTPTGYHEQSRTNIIGPTWAHPAYSGGFVYARDDNEVICVSLMDGATAVEPPQR